MSRRLSTGEELEETLRDLADRVRRLESARVVRLGDWRIEVDPVTQKLTAEYVPTGTVTVVASP